MSDTIREIEAPDPLARTMQAEVDTAPNDDQIGEKMVLNMGPSHPATHGVRAYAGNYSDYLEQKLAEGEHARQAYSDQQEEIGRLRNTANR